MTPSELHAQSLELLTPFLGEQDALQFSDYLKKTTESILNFEIEAIHAIVAIPVRLSILVKNNYVTRYWNENISQLEEDLKKIIQQYSGNEDPELLKNMVACFKANVEIWNENAIPKLLVAEFAKRHNVKKNELKSSITDLLINFNEPVGEKSVEVITKITELLCEVLKSIEEEMGQRSDSTEVAEERFQLYVKEKLSEFPFIDKAQLKSLVKTLIQSDLPRFLPPSLDAEQKSAVMQTVLIKKNHGLDKLQDFQIYWNIVIKSFIDELKLTLTLKGFSNALNDFNSIFEATLPPGERIQMQANQLAKELETPVEILNKARKIFIETLQTTKKAGFQSLLKPDFEFVNHEHKWHATSLQLLLQEFPQPVQDVLLQKDRSFLENDENIEALVADLKLNCKLLGMLQLVSTFKFGYVANYMVDHEASLRQENVAICEPISSVLRKMGGSPLHKRAELVGSQDIIETNEQESVKMVLK